MVVPASLLRRSPIYRKLVSGGARFAEVAGAAVAMEFREAALEEDAARRLALCDLFTLPRTGFKGAGTVEWMQDESVVVPSEPNRAIRQPDGALVARLGLADILVLADIAIHSSLVNRLNNAWPRAARHPRGYPLPRSDGLAWFAVIGECTPVLLSKLCAVDLRPRKFDHLQVAQTLVAQIAAIIVRSDAGGIPAYHLLIDPASANYLWDCLQDAMQEFSGVPIGLAALQKLASAPSR
jgi:sarcosine oxidase subunit gamma